jgi:uncharacterized membrane protein HdeD (DUF308 family)
MYVAVVDKEALARNWGALLLRGVVAILFGVLTFLEPGISLAALVLVFGAYAFADGVLAVVSAVRHRGTTEPAWLLLLEGIAGIAAGVASFLWPGITALALLYLIAARALVTGVFEVVAAIRLRKVIAHEWLLIAGGLASIAFGVLLMLFPGAGALGVVLWIGAYAIVFGTLLAMLAIRLRSHRSPGTATPRPAMGMA